MYKLLVRCVCVPFQLTVGRWKGDTGREQVRQYELDVIERMNEPPWNTTLAKERGLPVSGC